MTEPLFEKQFCLCPVPGQGRLALPCDWVPDANCPVRAATGEEFAIWTPGNGRYFVTVPPQGRQLLACSCLPNANRLVSAATGEELAIWTEAN